jgi:ATP-dependent RNA helicase DeaD
MSADLTPAAVRFADLGLSEPVLRALEAVGYESPSPIQAATIPPLLEGRDVLGQAQTGTGKTAAFALPALSNIDLRQTKPQVLVLAPTRELAIQVAEAFQKYAAKLSGFHVLPIYGGQSYGPQLSALRRGVHVVVGTPGRILDHMKRGTLNLDGLKYLVLDEADEMLRMGFIDDVEFILQKAPPQRQVALFSATMPSAIRRIAQTYLKSPTEITIKSKTTTATNIRQRYWMVSGMQKLDALTRILEAETFEGMIIFCRTKAATAELAEKLSARGFSAAALSGDVAQKDRERIVARLKNGQVDIVVATDVAARGLDVERISHVVNYDIPTDTESYVHRIGRTGRAGRSGDAILFLAPRERHLLAAIERATRQTIQRMELPTPATVNENRAAKFKSKITEALASEGLDPFRSLIENYEREHNIPALEIAAALARLVQGDKPLLLSASEMREGPSEGRDHAARGPRAERSEPRREDQRESSRSARTGRAEKPERLERNERPAKPVRAREAEAGMETYRIEVGHTHKVKPANIVGAIANEAGLDSEYIGRIEIFDDHSLVDLPEGMPKDTFRDLQKVWICGQQLKISKAAGDTPPPKKKEKSYTPKRG